MAIQRPRPIVDQVNEILRKRIHDRVYPPGGRLPAESELAQELGVSRATVRTVLAKMSTDGLILRKQGDGTYVNARIRDIDARWGSMWDFQRLISGHGSQATIQPLSTEKRLPTIQEQEVFNIDADEELLSLTRLFMADDKPAIWVQNSIPHYLLRDNSEIFLDNLTIQDFLEAYCQQTIAYAITQVEASIAGNLIAHYFACEENKPFLRLVEAFYNRDNEPLAFGLSFYDYTAVPLRLVQAWG